MTDRADADRDPTAGAVADADVEIHPDADRHEYDPDADHAFPDERLNEVLEHVLSDEEIVAYLEAQNVNPVARKGYNDHGTKHVEIVRDRALRLYDLLKRGASSSTAPASRGSTRPTSR